MPADMPSYAVLQATPIDKDNESEETTMKKSATGSPRRHALLIFLGMVISLFFGIQLGWQLSARYAVQEQQISRPSQLLPDLGEIKTAFTYDRIYAEVPTNESNAAWKEIFPARGGFFRHPQLAPGGSGLAVFHQLHCLDNIRRGYWSNAEDDGPHDSSHHISPAHIRHCIDYLRQSLMCHADTNIEPLDEKMHGVHGFGVDHNCRDFSGVRAWVSNWEDGIL